MRLFRPNVSKLVRRGDLNDIQQEVRVIAARTKKKGYLKPRDQEYLVDLIHALSRFPCSESTFWDVSLRAKSFRHIEYSKRPVCRRF